MKTILILLCLLALPCLLTATGMLPMGGVTVAPSAPSGVTVTSTWSMGESVLVYNPTSGIDAIWSMGESLILDMKE